MAMTTPPKMMDGVNELSDRPKPPCEGIYWVSVFLLILLCSRATLLDHADKAKKETPYTVS